MFVLCSRCGLDLARRRWSVYWSSKNSWEKVQLLTLTQLEHMTADRYFTYLRRLQLWQVMLQTLAYKVATNYFNITKMVAIIKQCLWTTYFTELYRLFQVNQNVRHLINCTLFLLLQSWINSCNFYILVFLISPVLFMV